jgi:aromatic ring-opening dioxygenase LigB subunit
VRLTAALLGGAVVPHAPLLLPELTSDEVAASALRIRTTCAELHFEGADAVVVLSPHAATSCVYRAARGSLDGFGVTGIGVDVPTEGTLAETLAEAWDEPLVDEPVDHGIVVALRLLEGIAAPLVCAGVEEGLGPTSEVRDRAISFADSVLSLAEIRAIAFVASANTSAGLSPRGPLTELPGAADVERRALDALDSDSSALTELGEDLARVAGSCGAGPLIAFGRLLGGRRSRLLAYEAPVGVGYPVAVVR